MSSRQTLSEADRRLVAAWAADCAERVLAVFEAEVPGDARPREAIERARAFSRRELSAAEEIKRRFVALAAAREARTPAGAAAARAAGQAAAVAHMGAHALGAAAYAVRAVELAERRRPGESDELTWQLDHASPAVLAALRQLPPVGEDAAGPLGPGLLASGVMGEVVRRLQAAPAVVEPQQRSGRATKTHDSGRNNPRLGVRGPWKGRPSSARAGGRRGSSEGRPPRR